MNQITLQLPKTLYRNLEILAENESVPLPQYIVYILTRQISGEYTVRVLPDEDIARQKISFDRLLKKWGEIPCSEIDAILDKREPAEPEAELSSETVSRLKERIARKRKIYN